MADADDGAELLFFDTFSHEEVTVSIICIFVVGIYIY